MTGNGRAFSSGAAIGADPDETLDTAAHFVQTLVACEVPVLVAAVGAMAELLADWPGTLYAPDDPASLLAGMRRQLQERIVPPLPVQEWDALAGELGDFLRSVAG
jgi:hypothetical protein